MDKNKICVVTGTRAEYGLLKKVIEKIKNDGEQQLMLMVTGTHLSKMHGNTQKEIIEDGFEFDRVSIPTDIKNDTDMAIAIGEGIKEYARFFDENTPDLVVVLGDRYEVFAVAVAAYTKGIPIAHISGGDVTEGALDDGYRNAITKLATLHFPGCDDSAERIVHMGENPNMVFSVGSTGVENCLNMDFMDIEELSQSIGFELSEKKYAVVTYHPVTREPGEALFQIEELYKALDMMEGYKYIITLANADAEGNIINDYWKHASETHPSWIVVPSLGVRRYLSAIKNAAVVIGNSSSGIIEAPALKTPTVNIGCRQKGRPMAESIINCEPLCDKIYAAIRKAVSKDFQSVVKKTKSLYGDGNTSSEIVNTIKDYLRND